MVMVKKMIGIKKHKILAFAACLLIVALILISVQTVKALDLPFAPYKHTYSASDIQTSPVLFDYSTSPAPANYDFEVTVDFSQITMDTPSDMLIFNVWDRSGGMGIPCFTIQLTYEVNSTFTISWSDNSNGQTYFENQPDSNVTLIKVGDAMTFYDENGNIIASGTTSQPTVGYCGIDGSAVSGSLGGSMTVTFTGSPSPSPSPSSSPTPTATPTATPSPTDTWRPHGGNPTEGTQIQINIPEIILILAVGAGAFTLLRGKKK
jgi:hypothetical protein